MTSEEIKIMKKKEELMRSLLEVFAEFETFKNAFPEILEALSNVTTEKDTEAFDLKWGDFEDQFEHIKI